MEARTTLTKGEVIPNDDPKLNSDDSYGCTTCSYPVEILKFEEDKNTVIFKCLNPKGKNFEKTIQINEFLNSMRKYTYLYSECSVCNKKQNASKNVIIFLYCIKCETIICTDCIDKHLKMNERNHHDLNKKYIIKYKEKNIKCLLHPIEKNLAFCLKCNIHICKECMKSQKHINHTKINLIEIKVTDEIKNMLNYIINIYKEKIIQLNKEKEVNELDLSNEKENIKKKIEKQKINKIEETQIELKKELVENEKLLNSNIYKLKIKYENEVKLCKNEFKISNENIIKKYKKLTVYYNKKFNEELIKMEKEYDNKVNMEHNKKIEIYKNLLIINQILKNTQENYPDNIYNNNNINKIVYNYYESKGENIKQILNKNVYNELLNKEKDEQKYKNFIIEIEKLKNKNGNKIISKDENDENKITMVYKINKNIKEIKVLSDIFVKNNKEKCKFFINNKKFKISEYIKYT